MVVICSIKTKNLRPRCRIFTLPCWKYCEQWLWCFNQYLIALLKRFSHFQEHETHEMLKRNSDRISMPLGIEFERYLFCIKNSQIYPWQYYVSIRLISKHIEMMRPASKLISYCSISHIKPFLCSHILSLRNINIESKVLPKFTCYKNAEAQNPPKVQ